MCITTTIPLFSAYLKAKKLAKMLKCFHIDLKWALEHNEDEKQKLNMNDDGAETLMKLNGDESSDETLAELNIIDHKNKPLEKFNINDNFDELNVNNNDDETQKLNVNDDGDESSASDEPLKAEEEYDEDFRSHTDMDDSADETYKPDQDSESNVSVLYNRKRHVKVINSCSEAEQSEVADSCSEEEEGTINIKDSPVLNQQSISHVSDMVDDSEEDKDSEEFESLSEEEIIRDSKNPKIYIRRVLKSRIAKHGKVKKHNRVYNSYQYCAPCKIKVSNFAQHLSRNSNKHHAHASVPEIMALREEENEALKKKLQSSLRGKFNHAFNMKTIKKGRGEILLERRPVTDFQLKNYGPCPNCFFW